jgi:hypothetical protein
MKIVVAKSGFILAAVFILTEAPALALKPCEELKAEIAAKLDAKGVTNYQLAIVAAADVKEDSVVGSCEGGTKKITYTKGSKPDAAAASAAKPANPPATR